MNAFTAQLGTQVVLNSWYEDVEKLVQQDLWMRIPNLAQLSSQIVYFCYIATDANSLF